MVADREALDDVVDDAWPACPACGTRLEDAGDDDKRPRLVCPVCGLAVIAAG